MFEERNKKSASRESSDIFKERNQQKLDKFATKTGRAYRSEDNGGGSAALRTHMNLSSLLGLRDSARARRTDETQDG